MKLLDELNNTKKKHNNLKAQYKTVVTEIKKCIKDSYYKQHEDSFRYAICLYYGEFVERYSMRKLPNDLKLSLSISWNNDSKHQISNSYYDIYKYWGNILDETSERVGFSCELKYLQEALKYEMKKLWLFNVNNNKYVDSFENFNKILGAYLFYLNSITLRITIL